MATKTILDRHLQADHIAATAAHHAGVVAAALDDDAFDWEAIQAHAGRRLHDASAKLLEADNALERQQHETKALRTEHRKAARALYDHVVTLRKVVTAAHGETVALKMLGLEGKTPRRPLTLAVKVREMVHRLLDPSVELPPSACKGFTFDREHLATDLAASWRPVEELMTAVREARRTEDLLLTARDREAERFRRLRIGLARVIEGLYLTAGLPELVPGLRTPGASVLKAVRGRPERVETAPHPVSEWSEPTETDPHLVPEEVETAEAPAHRVSEGYGSPEAPRHPMSDDREAFPAALHLVTEPSADVEMPVHRDEELRKAG